MSKPTSEKTAEPTPDPVPDEEQVCSAATLPQRIDAQGSKIEDLAGTGDHDSRGG